MFKVEFFMGGYFVFLINEERLIQSDFFNSLDEVIYIWLYYKIGIEKYDYVGILGFELFKILLMIFLDVQKLKLRKLDFQIVVCEFY